MDGRTASISHRLSEDVCCRSASGSNQTPLHFDGNCSISSDVDVEVLTPKKVRLRAVEGRKALVDLIGHIPQTSAFVDRTTFVMRFDEESTIVLHDDSEMYEPFQIRVGERLYII